MSDEGEDSESNINQISVICEQVYENSMTKRNPNQLKVDVTRTAAIVRATIQGSKFMHNVKIYNWHSGIYLWGSFP